MKFLALLLTCLPCFAQFPYSGVTWTAPNSALTPCQLAIGTGFPTNIAGYPAYTWWIAQCGYATNAGTATLTDFSGNGLNLTQGTLGNAPHAQSSIWGGFDGVLFGTPAPGTLANNTGFSIPSGNKCEFWCVMSYTNISGSDWLFHDVSAGNTGLAVAKDQLAATKWDMITDVTFNVVSATSTNKYIVYNFVFTQGANTTMYTNNVAGVNVNNGSGGLTSFRLAGGLNANNPMIFSFLEGGWFRTNLTTVGRSNLFYYCTNKYSLLP